MQPVWLEAVQADIYKCRRECRSTVMQPVWLEADLAARYKERREFRLPGGMEIWLGLDWWLAERLGQSG